MHSCWHTHPEGLYSADLPDVNRTTLNRHFAGVQLLMQSVRRAIDAANKATNGQSTTQVIVITSGATYSDNGTRMDDCISRFNRLFEIEAHKAGFAVLERGEIERRLMFKSLQSELPLLTPQMHLPQPAQNIVATCLLSMIQCLTDSGVHMGNISTDFLLDNLAERTRRHRTADIKPLHSPPG